MLTLQPNIRIYIHTGPTDMRKSMNGLECLVSSHLGEDPMSGHLFLFRNRRGNRLKILYWDRNGYVVWYKRLERGTFSFPSPRDGRVEIQPAVFQQLLGGLSLERVWKNREKMHSGA